MSHRPLAIAAVLAFPATALVVACLSSSDANPPGADGDAGFDAQGNPHPGQDGSSSGGDATTGGDGSPGDDGGPGTDGGPGGGPYFYAPQAGGLNVSVYTIDPVTGALTPVVADIGDPQTPGEHMAVAHPSGKFYFAIGGGGDIDTYTIDPATGKLHPVLGADGGNAAYVLAGSNFTWLAMDPQGRVLYAVDRGTGQDEIVTLTIDQATGALSLATKTPLGAGTQPYGLAVDPAGTFLFTDGYEGSATRVNLDTSGIPVSPDAGGVATLSVASECSQVAIGPDNVAYATCDFPQQGKGLYAFSYNGSSLSVQASDAGTPSFLATALAVHPSGKFVYVVNVGEIFTFATLADGGAPVLVASSNAGYHATSILVDPTGAHLYAGCGNSPSRIRLFDVNAATGALTPADVIDGGVPSNDFPTEALLIVPHVQ